MKKRPNIMLSALLSALLCTGLAGCGSGGDDMPSTRRERKLIADGNERFAAGDYAKSLKLYEKAVAANPTGPEANFNMATARYAYAMSLDRSRKQLADSIVARASQELLAVGSLRGRATGIASLALYNLGNINFRAEKYDEAETYYREALRLNPDFDEARRNLRITQLKKEDNKDNNQQNQQDQNQQNQNQQNQDQNQQDQQNQNQQNQDQNQQDQQNQSGQGMNEQTAEQILRSMENKESATRARIERNNDRRRNERMQGGRSRHRW